MIPPAVPDQDRPKNVVRRTPFPESGTSPLVPPIVPSAVFVARDADHMNDVYEGRERGFTYARESSPNAELLAANPSPTRAQIVSHMNGNICRCGTYHRIAAAIERAAREG